MFLPAYLSHLAFKITITERLLFFNPYHKKIDKQDVTANKSYG